ncbi:hypothetical protein SAMN04487906_2795 [Zhouia amylolytica]|uniref:Cytochrome C and Quinol oxidase polypeptide I n=1 Tax=Zhouia amylolytica TaxID=376730 RepID=A0A1I6V1Q7_9FLAO|nr:hypothetical protein [Zhouia amylolytica]SFT07527.1 hypothetical protein SAMN04487906_2795 [Zhouia amylolytica]
MLKKLTVVCLINFLIAALMGLTMRLAFISPLNINYRFLTHGHSHVAMLGWLYLMLFTLIVHFYIPNPKKVYERLFWLTEISVIGMMISFPLQGYAAVSISFSTLHIFCSYFFVYRIWKDLGAKSFFSIKLLKTALIFMLISTIGVWCLGPAMVIAGPSSPWYQIAIQFFLHFQFNGWFLIAVLALLIKQFEKLGLLIDNHNFKKFYQLLIIATICTISLPVSWYLKHVIFSWINGLGVILQLGALGYFIKFMRPLLKAFWLRTNLIAKHGLRFALACFVLKIIIQSFSLIPEIASISFQIKNFVIGFIHLTMLGVITGFLFAFMPQTNLIRNTLKWFGFGFYLFLYGFLGTELILFIQGVLFYLQIGLIDSYYQILFVLSSFLPAGIFCILVGVYKNKINNNETTTIKTT